jgi:hypothetical protein
MAGQTRKKKTPTIPPARAKAPEPPPNDVPTRKDLDLIAAWKRLQRRTGEPPTTRALAEELGLSQTATQWRIEHCAAKGLLVRGVVQVPGPYQISNEGEKWLAAAS